MDHPGPPRFAAVGESVDLAPRDPDPDATYRWHVADRPADSAVTLGPDPVVEFVPDVPGRYALELSAPGATYRLTVRAFPGEYAVGAGEGESGRSGYSGKSGYSGRSGRSGPGRSGSGGSGVAGPGDRAGAGRLRIHLSGERSGDGVVLRADVDRLGDDDPAADVEFYVDDRDVDALDPDALDAGDRGATLPLPEAPVRIHAVAVGDGGYSVPDEVRVHPDGTVEHPTEPPEWSKDATIYEVYLRGYTDAAEGEVFDRLADRLDDLAEFGVDTIWLTPILENDHAPHGYNIVDFFSVAADLGTRESFEAFVDAAHDRGIRVLFDLVLNHSAREHPFFQDAYRNPDSEYYDWYEWQESGEPGTYFDWEYIANFDYSTLSVRRHLLDAVDEWAPVVDGFRCDMAWAVPRSFWMEVRDRVLGRDDEFLLLDETVPYVADFHGRLFDVHFDTTLYFNLRQVGHGDAPASAVVDAVEQRTRVGFPDHAGFALYLENHDERRYLEECGRGATEAAAGVQFTLPGVPMLYGGQEIGATERRGVVRWEEADPTLQDYYRALIETRESTPALGYRGDFEPVDVDVGDGDPSRVVAYAREADDRYVVACNFGDDPATVAVPGESVDPVDRITGESVASDGGVAVESVVVLPVQPDA